MTSGKHCEIERKYLIRYPDTRLLSEQPGCEIWDIVQTYLTDGEGGQTRRVRQVTTGGRVTYHRTFKRRLSALSAEEDEGRIDLATYAAYVLQRDTSRTPIVKTRYRVPYHGHVLEFDIYPFWCDRAIMEIELQSEDETPDIPEWVGIIRDVTSEKAYKNRQLAKRVPMEEI
ncbi:MAG: hypothetical protein IJJ45_03100 [Clostridia bacterium]|nr:hypothetical protein [Clostridia bacterium]